MQPRLLKEQKLLSDKNYAVIKQENAPVWQVLVNGPAGSPFEGGQFTVKFKLDGFPFKAPIVEFVTQIYHPNVDPKGQICADMLQIGQKWAPVKNLITIMDKIISLMAAPNLQSPMNEQAAKDYKNNTWAQKAKKMTQTYAKNN